MEQSLPSYIVTIMTLLLDTKKSIKKTLFSVLCVSREFGQL